MRIFTGEIKGNSFVLEGDSHVHVAYSLRSKVGDAVTLCPQNGYDYECRIEKITSDKTFVSVLSRTKSKGEPRIKLTVFAGVPNKADKIELVAQKLTELGALEIRPIITEYVVGKDGIVKEQRLNKIVEEAAKQCGRGVIPKVFPPIKFSEAIERLSEFDLVVFPYECENENPIKEFLRSNAKKSPEKVALVVGAEGGFSPAEVMSLRERGITPVTLGNRILRTETASIAVASAIMYELDEWKAKDDKDEKK